MMRRNAPGSIVLIGSMSGAAVNIPQPQSPYNASKAGTFHALRTVAPPVSKIPKAHTLCAAFSAVRHLASSLAVEWATKNVRVNVISPGYMATALTRVILDRDPELRDAWVNLTPMGRIGEPEDLKGAVIYLASDASAFTTGADLRVDGGYTLVSHRSRPVCLFPSVADIPVLFPSLTPRPKRRLVLSICRYLFFPTPPPSTCSLVTPPTFLQPRPLRRRLFDTPHYKLCSFSFLTCVIFRCRILSAKSRYSTQTAFVRRVGVECTFSLG